MKKLFIFIIIFILLFLVLIGWWNRQLSPVSTDKQTKTVIIPKGQSVAQIAEMLKKENLIRSTLVFSLYIKQQNLAGSLQAGTFKLSPNMSTPDIVEDLKGGPSEVWVTLLEGWRVEEMAAKLNKELSINSEEFIKQSQEGYMFPDTYLFPKDITVEQIVKILRNNFEDKYSNDLKAQMKSKGLTESEGTILASIVEREARSDEARKMVASILLKRLKIEMGLNADATVQYALGYQRGEKGWWKKSLTKDDLKIDSNYNSYLHRGLPPTPICNPGLASLKAVANADTSTPYLYYYHDNKGNSYYAKTLDEHNQNVANHP